MRIRTGPSWLRHSTGASFCNGALMGVTFPRTCRQHAWTSTRSCLGPTCLCPVAIRSALVLCNLLRKRWFHVPACLLLTAIIAAAPSHLYAYDAHLLARLRCMLYDCWYILACNILPIALPFFLLVHDIQGPHALGQTRPQCTQPPPCGYESTRSSDWQAVAANMAEGLDIRFKQLVTNIRWHQGGVVIECQNGQQHYANAAICTLPLGVLKVGASITSDASAGVKLRFCMLAALALNKCLVNCSASTSMSC